MNLGRVEKRDEKTSFKQSLLGGSGEEGRKEKGKKEKVKDHNVGTGRLSWYRSLHQIGKRVHQRKVN